VVFGEKNKARQSDLLRQLDSKVEKAIKWHRKVVFAIVDGIASCKSRFRTELRNYCG
jgi:hypothetical protein